MWIDAVMVVGLLLALIYLGWLIIRLGPDEKGG